MTIQSLSNRSKWVYILLCISSSLILLHCQKQTDPYTAITQALQDQESAVRKEALAALGSYKTKALSALPRMIQLLKDENESVRLEAIRTIGKIGPKSAPAIPSLSAQMGQGQTLTKAAAEALRSIGKAAIPVLVKQFLSDQPHAHFYARRMLILMGQKTVSALLKLCRSADPRIKERAANALRLMDRRVDIPIGAILPLVRDKDLRVRLAALWILSKRTSSSITPAMTALFVSLKDTNRWLQAAAEKQLVRIGKQAIPQLKKNLKYPRQDVQLFAASALIHIGIKNAQITEVVHQTLRNKVYPTRKKAAKLMKLIHPQSDAVIRSLIAMFEDRQAKVAKAAAKAIAAIGSKALPALLVALRSQHFKTRTFTAKALGYMGKRAKSSVPTLLIVLATPETQIQELAAQALGKIGDPRAIPGLMQALKSSQPMLKSHAVYALGEIGRSNIHPVKDTLVQALQAKQFDTKRAAATAIGRWGTKALFALPKFVELMQESTGQPKLEMIDTMVKMGPEAWARLLDLLPSSSLNRYEKNAAMQKLSRHLYKTPSVLPVLLKLEQPKVFGTVFLIALRQTMQKLVKREGKRAIPMLLASYQGKNQIIQSRVLELLKQLGESASKAAPTLLKWLEMSKKGENCQLLALALRETSRKMTLDLDKILTSSDPQKVSCGIQAIGDTETTNIKIVNRLKKLTHSKKKGFIRLALAALGRIKKGYAPASKYIIPFTKHDDWRIQQVALRALTQ